MGKKREDMIEVKTWGVIRGENIRESSGEMRGNVRGETWGHKHSWP